MLGVDTQKGVKLLIDVDSYITDAKFLNKL